MAFSCTFIWITTSSLLLALHSYKGCSFAGKWRTAKSNIHLKTTGITSKETKVVVEDVVKIKKRSEIGLTLAEDLADSFFTLWGDLLCAFLWRCDGSHLSLLFHWHRTRWWIIYNAANVPRLNRGNCFRITGMFESQLLDCCVVKKASLGSSICALAAAFERRFEVSRRLQFSVKSPHVWRRFLGLTGDTSSPFQNSWYNCKPPQQPPFFLHYFPRSGSERLRHLPFWNAGPSLVSRDKKEHVLKWAVRLWLNRLTWHLKQLENVTAESRASLIV